MFPSCGSGAGCSACCGQSSRIGCCSFGPWLTTHSSSHTPRCLDGTSELLSSGSLPFSHGLPPLAALLRQPPTCFGLAPLKCCPPSTEWPLQKADLSAGTLWGLLGSPGGWRPVSGVRSSPSCPGNTWPHRRLALSPCRLLPPHPLSSNVRFFVPAMAAPDASCHLSLRTPLQSVFSESCLGGPPPPTGVRHLLLVSGSLV